MVRPVNVERVATNSFEEKELAPLSHLDALWHYQCVVSPRSPAAKLQSNPVSPRSHAPPATSPPPSPASKIQGGRVSRFATAQESLRRVFSTFDENRDGSVSTQEISGIFEKLGLSSSEDSLLTNIPSLVSDAPCHVDEEGFLLLYQATCHLDDSSSSSSVNAGVDEDLLAAFHVFDKDGNGFISPAELQSVLCSLGFPQGRQPEACVDMIARVDENRDGQVDFFEFKKLFHMDNPFISPIQSF